MSYSRPLLAAVFLAALAAASPAVAASGCTGAAGEVDLEISVQGVRSTGGEVVITVYDSADKFLAKGGKLDRVRLSAAAPVTKTCIRVPHPGDYAVTVYHDENGNGKFDKTMVGLPAEGYGVSRVNGGLLGIPSFDDVKFTAKPGRIAVPVKLNY